MNECQRPQNVTQAAYEREKNYFKNVARCVRLAKLETGVTGRIVAGAKRRATMAICQLHRGRSRVSWPPEVVIKIKMEGFSPLQSTDRLDRLADGEWR